VDLIARQTLGRRHVGAALLLLLSAAPTCAQTPSRRAREAADHARQRYGEAAVAALAELVGFETVHRPGVDNAENPEFRQMTAGLERRASEMGLDFADHGAVVLIGLGDAAQRLGVVTHADVQPADPSKWARDPFSLDVSSEPGRLVGRGVEDDKGPIVACLFAMKAVKDRGIRLERRIELIISYTEESDWDAFEAFLHQHPPPGLNVVLDAQYPVVSAEKGWGTIHLSLPAAPRPAPAAEPSLTSFTGGAFLSQIPEDARASIAAPSATLEAALRDAAERDAEVRYRFSSEGGSLIVEAQGRAAHSSTPWDGRNAITHLAAVLGAHDWPDTPASRMVRLINDLVGTGDYAERFGDVAYSHPFMGRLTLTLATLSEDEGRLVAGISLRRPAGRGRAEVKRTLLDAVEGWKRRAGVGELTAAMKLYDPHYLEDAPHIPVLLAIFRHYTGREDAEPVAMGGGTHARLVPSGVNFGPSMPGEDYTGHSEHEFMSREQFLLNLQMYTAMLVELAGAPPPAP
jgi:dipeptidase D